MGRVSTIQNGLPPNSSHLYSDLRRKTRYRWIRRKLIGGCTGGRRLSFFFPNSLPYQNGI
jgi:hypothetical protein